MVDMVIITPTRGRPQRLEKLYDAVQRTAMMDTVLAAAVDIGDPEQQAYAELDRRYSNLTVFQGPRRSLSSWTNEVAHKLLRDLPNPPRYLVTLGDDHVPETPGWDRRCAAAIEALGGELGGWAWGPDGFRRDRLPTWWVMSSTIVRRLGYVMLPTCGHMYVDNATQVLAEAAQRAVYLPDVMVRHETPFHVDYRHLADEGFARVNRPEQYERDGAAFARWRFGGGLSDDIAKLTRE